MVPPTQGQPLGELGQGGGGGERGRLQSRRAAAGAVGDGHGIPAAALERRVILHRWGGTGRGEGTPRVFAAGCFLWCLDEK